MSIMYINEQGAYLRKQSGRFVVTKKDDELASIPEAAIDKVVIFGNVQISTQAMSELMSKGIEVVFLSINGKFKGFLEPGYPKNIFTRMAQYEAALDEERSLKLAKWFIRNKINSQKMFIRNIQLKRWIDNTKYLPNELNQYLILLQEQKNINGILSVEGAAAKIYFSIFNDITPPPFEWNGRNRQPPVDPVNALLSLTYMMVLSEIISQCYIQSFDPFIGFMHQLEYSRPSFALDVIELCRSLYCDYFVFLMFQQEVFQFEDFVFTPKNGCRLKSEPFKLYLKKYRDFFNTSDKYRLKLNKFISTQIRIINNFFTTSELPENIFNIQQGG